MILMPQIFDVTANENARYKHNELEYVSYWWHQWKQPSYFMPPALIKATYNDYSGISHLTDSLSSLSK